LPKMIRPCENSKNSGYALMMESFRYFKVIDV
jgi:hypothetical protein